jgi:hypothetical protein
MGKDAYAILAEHCDRRMQGIRDAQALVIAALW